jgi:hypothetical protein
LLVLSSFTLLLVIAPVNVFAAYCVPVATVVAVVLALRPRSQSNLFFAVQGLALFEVLVILVTGISITS